MPEHLLLCPGSQEGRVLGKSRRESCQEDQSPESLSKFPEKELVTLPHRGCDGKGVLSFLANGQIQIACTTGQPNTTHMISPVPEPQVEPTQGC